MVLTAPAVPLIQARGPLGPFKDVFLSCSSSPLLLFPPCIRPSGAYTAQYLSVQIYIYIYIYLHILGPSLFICWDSSKLT